MTSGKPAEPKAKLLGRFIVGAWVDAVQFPPKCWHCGNTFKAEDNGQWLLLGNKEVRLCSKDAAKVKRKEITVKEIAHG